MLYYVRDPSTVLPVIIRFGEVIDRVGVYSVDVVTDFESGCSINRSRCSENVGQRHLGFKW